MIDVYDSALPMELIASDFKSDFWIVPDVLDPVGFLPEL